MCHRYRRPDSLSRPRHAGQRRAARAAAAGAAHARRRPRPRHGGWVRRGCALRGLPLASAASNELANRQAPRFTNHEQLIGSPLRPPRRPHRGGRTRGDLRPRRRRRRLNIRLDSTPLCHTAGALQPRLCGRRAVQLPCPLPRGGRRRHPLYGAPLRVEAAGDGTVAAAAAAAAARRGSARPSRRRRADGLSWPTSVLHGQCGS